LRPLSIIRFGTEGYPEKVARRLRAVNIAAWVGAMAPATFAVLRLTDPAPGMFSRGLINAGIAVVIAAVPLLHRLGPLAAPLVLVALSFAQIFRTSYQVGTDGGAYLYYLTATALAVLLIGIEHVVLTAAIAAIAAALIVILHLVAPDHTGLISSESLFWGNFVTNVVVNVALLFIVVFYAFRQAARAEESAERELRRSESLLSMSRTRAGNSRPRTNTNRTFSPRRATTCGSHCTR
jgi:adenylate cyclase